MAGEGRDLDDRRTWTWVLNRSLHKETVQCKCALLKPSIKTLEQLKTDYRGRESHKILDALVSENYRRGKSRIPSVEHTCCFLCFIWDLLPLLIWQWYFNSIGYYRNDTRVSQVT